MVVPGDSVFLCNHVRAESRAGRSFHVLEVLPDQVVQPGDDGEYKFMLLCNACMRRRGVDPECPIDGETIVLARRPSAPGWC
jgi:hypothetical protein